jgi:hypothetical protein
MENKKERLKHLIKRNSELKPITTQSFKTDKELDSFEKKNKMIFDEYYDNMDEIEKLEYELMTPKEKERYDKGMRFLELKAKGDPFDLSEFEDLNP